MFLRDIQKKRQTICGIYVSGCDTEKSTRHLETTQGAFLVSQAPGPLGTSREVDVVTPVVSWAKQRRVISIRMRVTKHTHIAPNRSRGSVEIHGDHPSRNEQHRHTLQGAIGKGPPLLSLPAPLPPPP